MPFCEKCLAQQVRHWLIGFRAARNVNQATGVPTHTLEILRTELIA